MGVFVGAEYLIANALLVLKRKGVDKLPFSQLQEFGIQVQKTCLEQNIDALFLTSFDQVYSAVYNFSDYFSFEEIDGIDYLSITQDAPIEDIKNRFIGFLPVDVIMVILEKAKALAE